MTRTRMIILREPMILSYTAVVGTVQLTILDKAPKTPSGVDGMDVVCHSQRLD
jgi:hypothetical protein